MRDSENKLKLHMAWLPQGLTNVRTAGSIFPGCEILNFWNTGASGRGNGRIWLPGLAGPSPMSGRALQPGPPRTELKEKSRNRHPPGLRAYGL